MHSLRIKWVLAILLIGFLITPAVIFFLELFFKGIAIKELFSQILRQQFADDENLFWLSLYGMIPFLLHSLFCYAIGKVYNRRTLNCYALIGMFSILACMIPMHIFAWLPVYEAGRISSTSGLVFIFIPWFCVLSLGLGLCLSWVVTKHPYFRATDA